MATKQLSIIITAIDQMSGPAGAAARALVAGFGLINNAATKVASGLRTVGDMASKVFSILRTVFTAPGDSFLVRGLQGLFGGVSSELDAIAKASRRLGISTETLSELRYAAKLSNIEFAGLADAAATAQRNIAKFATFGSGKAKESLQLLNLQLKDQYGRLRNIGDLLPEIADRLKSLPVEQRGLAAKGLFGDQAQAFITLLENGSQGLRESREGARRTGAIYSREQVEAIERYNDAVTRVGEAWLSVKAKITAEVAPVIEGFLNRVADVLASLPPRILTVGRLIRNSLSLDDLTRASAGESLGKIVGQFTNALQVTVVELAKTGAQLFIDALIVGFRLIGPSLGDIFRDIAADIVGPVLKEFGKDNPITKSLRGQIRDAESTAATDLPQLRTKLANAQAKLDEELAYKVQPYDYRRAQTGLEQDVRLSRLREEVEKYDRQIKIATTGLAELRQRATALDVERGKAVADGLAAAGVSFVEVAVPGFERIKAAYAKLADVTDEAGGFVGQIPVTPEAAAQSETAVNGFADSVASTIQRIGVFIKDDLLSPAARGVAMLKEFALQARAAGQFLPELQARQATLRGDDALAARIRFEAQQNQERAGIIAQLPPGLRAQAEDVLNKELRLFEARQKAAKIVESLNERYEQYRDRLEQVSEQVQIGELKQFQATRQTQEAADAVRTLGEETRTQLGQIRAEYQDLPDVTGEFSKRVLEVLKSVGSQRPGPSGTFFGGLRDGFQTAIDKARDFESQGKEAAQSLSDSLTSDLGSAIFQVGQNFKNVGAIAQNFAASVLRSLGEIASKMLATRIIGSAFSILGLGAAATGGIVMPGGIQRYAMGGIVPPGEDTIIGVRYGEGVLRREAMQSLGAQRFHDINRRGAAALGGGGISISMSVTINGGDTKAVAAQIDTLPRRIVNELRANAAYRGDMNAALEGG